MRLILHIVAKDLRRMRGWIVLFAVITALPIALGLAVIWGRGDWRLVAIAPPLSRALIVAQIAIGYVLTIVLVREDAVIGGNPFWTTRPIGSLRLLIAKVIAAAVILAGIPLLISLPWWLWCGFGVGEIGQAAIEIGCLALLIALPAMFMAAVSDSFPRAILWSFVMFAVFLAVIPMLPAYINIRTERGVYRAIAGLALVIPMLAVCMLMAVLVQYVKRRVSWWLAAIAALFVISVRVITLLPLASLFDREPSQVHPERAASITVSPRPPAHFFDMSKSTRGRNTEPMDNLTVWFNVSGAPAGLYMEGLLAHQEWRLREFTLRRDEPLMQSLNEPLVIMGMTSPESDPETEQWMKNSRAQHGMPERPNASAVGRDPTLHITSYVPPSIRARIIAEFPGYTARLWLRTFHPELYNELSLHAVGWQRGEHHAARVATFVEQAGNGRARIVDATPGSRWVALRDEFVGRLILGKREKRGYVAFNRSRGEFVSINSEQSRSLLINGVSLTSQIIIIRPYGVRRGGAWVPQPSWLDAATLGYFALREDSLFVREVAVDRFESVFQARKEADQPPPATP
jgi:hypothetical protein